MHQDCLRPSVLMLNVCWFFSISTSTSTSTTNLECTGLPQTICTGARLRGRTGTLFLLSQPAIWGGGGAFAQLDRVPFTANAVSDQPINDRGSLEKYNNETRGPWWTLNCRWNRFATLLHDWWHLVPLVLYTRQGKSKFRPPYVQTGRVSSFISVKWR